ncbi:MAG: hypothetical protein AVDCRST_MAG86-1190 [uncultured Truepera sp.]|uniref:Uncharacterized protein n=1 Tax=uncultured Truepera sp. TaxID=543023 RepID=A0A6J4V3H2_9DEIN|nr:MAG: hypothetical protein AVDCRST_MAG86-1190 [uncultured Truepera sp.]
MLPPLPSLRTHLRAVIKDKNRQGHTTTGLTDELERLPDSYDALHAFSKRIATLPLREDWPYIEPAASSCFGIA